MWVIEKKQTVTTGGAHKILPRAPGAHGSPWVPMGPHGPPWGPMGARGGPAHPFFIQIELLYACLCFCVCPPWFFLSDTLYPIEQNTHIHVYAHVCMLAFSNQNFKNHYVFHVFVDQCSKKPTKHNGF